MSASPDAHLSRETLLRRVADLQAANTDLRRRLRAAEAAGRRDVWGSPPRPSGGKEAVESPTRGSSPSPVRRTTVDRLGLTPVGVRWSDARVSPPRGLPYDISMSVMVIEGGAALAVPLSTLLRPTDDGAALGEADTPIVASKYLRDTHATRRRRLSRGGEDSAGAPSGGRCLEEAFDAVGRPSLGGRPSVGPEGGAGRPENGLEGTETDEETVEPRPVDPRSSFGAEKTTEAEAEAATPPGPAMSRLRLSEGALFRANGVLDTGAIVSHQTLRLFNRRFARDARALSPLSSYGNAVYHYMVRTFAVQNGCRHAPEDVEGFGRTLLHLCEEVQRILQEESSHTTVWSPCYVFGDLHGNFQDLFYFMDNLISFQDLRYTPHRFVFLGDYVDRGAFSVEVVAYLFAMKVLAPDKVLLLRGNHEDTLVSGDVSGYGNTSFRAQCHAVLGVALGETLWHRASEAFAYLPLTANIDERIFCTHGGIPRYYGGMDSRLDLLKSDDFPAMLSFFEAPDDESPSHQRFRQLAMETCWADPAEEESRLDRWGFGANPRGAGVILFGSKAVDDFLEHFGFELIFRAHQEKSDGLKLSKSGRVFTIFSTSAYVGHQNGAGVVLVADNKIRLIVKNADRSEEDGEGEPGGLRTTDSIDAVVAQGRHRRSHNVH